MLGTIFLTILFALILPGCVLVNPTEPFKPVSPTEATGIAGTAPDPITPTSQPSPAEEKALPEALTLERALEISLKNNPEVAATLWDVSVAGAKLDQAKAARWPTLDLRGQLYQIPQLPALV